MSGCAAAEHCASFDRATSTPGWATDPATLCPQCLRFAADEIAQLIDDYHDLGGLEPAAGGLTQRVSGHHEPPTPINLTADAVQRHIVFTLTAWEPAVREAAGLPPERTGSVRPAWAVATAVQVIAPRLALMSSLRGQCGFFGGWRAGPVVADGVDGIAALRRLHSRCRGMLGVTRLVHRLPGDCSGCGLAALRRDDGRDTVYCGSCARRWTLEDYRRYIGLCLEAVR